MIINKAKIKAGNDNRQASSQGALMKWEDIIGVKTGTIVDVISQSEDKKVAVISFPAGAISACGKKTYRPGQKKLVPYEALEKINLDTKRLKP